MLLDVFPLYGNPLFQNMCLLLMGGLAGLTLVLWLLKKMSPFFAGGMKISQSWLSIAPFIFTGVALDTPYSLYALTLLSIYGAKNFFQMTGMYHRTSFVLVCYIGIFACAYCIQNELLSLYNLLPTVVLFLASLIPLLKNAYKNMVQFMALTLLNFCFLWAFLHLGLLLSAASGAFLVLYIVVLTEFFDTIYLAISKSSRKIRLVHNITPKRSLEGFVLAGLVTLALGFSLRHYLPEQHPLAWAVVGFICCLFGSTGDTVLAVVRRDLGIKVTDAFIWGRGDFFSRLDRLVFVAPMAYYALLFMGRLA